MTIHTCTTCTYEHNDEGQYRPQFECPNCRRLYNLATKRQAEYERLISEGVAKSRARRIANFIQ